MSNFSSLPLELVVGIIQLNEDDADLRALCAVCKTISAIAQPLLYHEINLVHGDSALSLFLLTRTIIHSPQIAAWIRCLKIDALTREKGQYGMCREDVDNFSIAVDRLGERYEVSEFLTTSNSQPAILAALLVSCTTNLAELTMHVNQNGVALLSALGQQPTVGYSCLSKIESLSLICSGEAARKDEVCFDSITPLFLLLPRLNRIWISGCFGHNNIRRANLRSSRPYKTPPLLLPQTLPITLVSFTQSYLTASNLRALISACKDLKDFSFTNRRPGKGRQQGQEQQFNPIDLYSALDCQKSNLEDLRVSLETDFISQAFDWDGCNYGSFRECTQMKFLEVDERFLSLPPAGFPASLEYLVIHNCQSSVFELLSYLATLVSTGTELTSLKTISLYAHILFPGAMLGLPLKGASDLLFRKAQQDLTSLFLGTEVTLRFESGLLEKTVLGYEAASEDGYIGDYEPFVYIE